MSSAARAIAWQFSQRHRWGLVALAVYLLALAIIKLVIIATGQPVSLDSPERFAVVVVVPLTATFTYFLAVFSFGFSGDLGARRSMYPARMFTLPVATAALAGWPMLYGTAAISLLWLALRLLVIWPSGIDVPVIWPALMGAVLLAWTQALTWMPYGLPGLRVIVAVLWLALIDAVVLLAIHFKAQEPLVIAFLAPQLPLAYVAACYAVARARRGDVPEWRGMFARPGQLADLLPRLRDHFPSTARAQAWFEWRRHGRSLPALVGILLPFELALLFLTGNDTPVLVFSVLLGVLLTPPVMAAFAAATVRESRPAGGDAYGMTPFTAARPVTGAALIAAKLEMTIRSTVAAWLLVFAAIPLALILSGTWPVVLERARRGIEIVGTARAIVIPLLVFSALFASTWKQLVQTLYVGLAGREWLIKASVLLALSFLTLIGPIAQWVMDDSGVQAALWDALPWILALLVGFKISAAAWVATRLHQSRLLSDRTFVSGAACWVVAVLVLYAVLAWLLSTQHFPHYVLLLVAILEIPLVRVAAAPLALAWNRHR